MTEHAPDVRDKDQKCPELTTLRLDYAWKWFEFHASQRITMFSFFLIVGGILANAYVAAATNGPWFSACAVGIVGTLASVSFIFLDCRNRQLVKLAEDVLVDIESTALFAESIAEQKHGNGQTAGILKRDEVEAEAASWPRREFFRHKLWIRLMEFAVGIAFAAASVVACVRGCDKAPSRPTANTANLQSAEPRGESSTGIQRDPDGAAAE